MVTVQDQFREFSKYFPVISTTFNFEFQTIRNMISPSQSIREGSIIITDRSCLYETSQSQPYANQGSSYYVYPAYNIGRRFHPKVTIGLEDGILKVLLGSHNLTQKGVKENLEITGLIRIPLCQTYEEQLQEISSFIENLSNCIKLDDIAKRTLLHFAECSRDLHTDEDKRKQNVSFFFLHSFRNSILKQILEYIPSINKVTVCAPTLSQNEYFINEIIRTLGGKATFLIDPKVFSVGDSAKETYEKYNVKRLEIKNNRYLHAKFFVFHTKKGDWTLYGSPNFTDAALWKNAESGGNIEAAILLPPSDKWNWKSLFKHTVKMSPIQWSELLSVDSENQENKEETNLIEGWGFITSNNEGVILCRGLADGTIVIVRLVGINRDFRVKIVNGLLRFKIPSDWTNETRFVVLDLSGNMIVSGFLNRTGVPLSEFSELDINEVAKVNLWFYLRKLRNFKLKANYSNQQLELLDIRLDPSKWRLGPIASAWKPFTRAPLNIAPLKIYDKAERAFKEAEKEYHNKRAKSRIDVKVKNLLYSLDLLIEGAFYAFYLSNGGLSFLIKLTKCLSDFFRLPSVSYPKERWNIEQYKENYISKFDEETLNQWQLFGNRFQLDVCLLFDFWLYHNSKTRGYQSSKRKPKDVLIITNKYYQILKTIRMLINPEVRDASYDRIWDSRLNFMSAFGSIRTPSSFKELEDYLNQSYIDVFRAATMNS